VVKALIFKKRVKKIRKYMKTMMFLTMALALVACGKNGGGKSSSHKAETPVSIPSTPDDGGVIVSENATFKVSTHRKVELEKDHSNLEAFKQNINSHVVKFEAVTGHYSDHKVECKRSFYDRSNEVYSAYFDKSGLQANVDIELLSTDPGEAEFKCTLSSKGEDVDHVSLPLYKSFIVSGQTSFKTALGTEKFGTLLLEKDGVLVSGEDEINLSMKEFISLGGKILTWEESKVTTTSPDTIGKSGSKISIQTEMTSGELKVELRGLNGGKQTKIPEKQTEIPAADPSLDGKPGNDSGGSCNGCIGKKGHKGFQGKKGFPGMPGGATGKFEMSVSKSSDLKLEIKYFPGIGGQGGLGGEGGEGGPGGKGAVGQHWESPDIGCRSPRCRLARQASVNEWIRSNYPGGLKGDGGIQGENGDQGVKGAIEHSRFFIASPEMEHIITDDWKNFN
jgi:hypothetical protein